MTATDPQVSLYSALVAAQAVIAPAIKDSNNPAFRTKYADLGAVWDAAMPALKSNDLAIIQMPGEYCDGRLSLTTMVIHKDGGQLSEKMSVPVSKPDAQGCGSALTYMRRYALAAFLGITQEDDDGNAASGGQRDTAPRQNTPARAPERVTAPVPAPPVPATSDGNAWKSLLKLMPEERVAKKDVERIINGWSPVHLDAWLDADNTRTVQLLILKAKGMVPA